MHAKQHRDPKKTNTLDKCDVCGNFVLRNRMEEHKKMHVTQIGHVTITPRLVPEPPVSQGSPIMYVNGIKLQQGPVVVNQPNMVTVTPIVAEPPPLIKKKIFKCGICDQSYPNMNQLTSHLSTAHGKIPCRICSAVVAPENMDRHLQVRHPESVPKAKASPQQIPFVQLEISGTSSPMQPKRDAKSQMSLLRQVEQKMTAIQTQQQPGTSQNSSPKLMTLSGSDSFVQLELEDDDVAGEYAFILIRHAKPWSHLL
jgi:hypothetical protein